MLIFFFVPCCLSPLSSTDLLAGVVCFCMRVLLSSNNRGGVCVWSCCNRVCILVLGLLCMLKCTVWMSAAQNLSFSPACCSGGFGAAFRSSGCWRLSVQRACCWEQCQSWFLLCLIYNCWSLLVRSLVQLSVDWRRSRCNKQLVSDLLR